MTMVSPAAQTERTGTMDTKALAQYLRSARTLSQAQVDQRTRKASAQHIPASARWSAVQAHHTASPAGH